MGPIELPEEKEQTEEIDVTWTAGAEERLKRIPGFARGMARRLNESRA